MASNIHKYKTWGVFVASLIAFSFAGIDFYRTPGKEIAFDILVVFAAIILPDRVGEIFRGYQDDADKEEIDTFFDNLPKYLSNAHDIIWFPTRFVGLEYCTQSALSTIRPVTHIRNTVLRYSLRPTASATKTKENKLYYDWLEARKAAALRGCEITEIISRHLKADDPVRKYAIELEGKSNAFRFKTIDDVANPMVQMTIFDFDDHREVLFGWELPGQEKGQAFLSRNPHLVEYFECYFNYNYGTGKKEWST